MQGILKKKYIYIYIYTVFILIYNDSARQTTPFLHTEKKNFKNDHCRKKL
jgi:hypothetical protein